MDSKKEFSERKSTRLNKFDYSSTGAYFVTICVQERKPILSEIIRTNNPSVNETNNIAVGGDVLDAPNYVKLLPYGEIAEKYINQINDYYDNIKIDSYVIMPDHIHAIIVIKTSKDANQRNGASRTSPPTRQHSTIPKIVSTFKRFCNKEYGENIWQESYYDHIIRDNDDYETRRKYIYDNPIKWYYDNI
ncbi:MAG: transposase [Clostridia bacterium]|nr:transposase [Clostridia bacterium]